MNSDAKETESSENKTNKKKGLVEIEIPEKLGTIAANHIFLIIDYPGVSYVLLL